MRQVVVTGREAVELWERPDPGPPAAGEVRIRARLSLVSTGTESRVVRGDPMPVSVRDSFADLDAFVLQPAPPRADANRPVPPSLPASLGYNLVGSVEAAGSEVRERHPLGQLVMTLTRHVDVVNLPATQVMPIPDGVEPERAVFSYLATLGLHALRRVTFAPGERVVVLGLGVVGATAALMAAACGAVVLALEPNVFRREAVAGRRGIRAVLDPADDELADRIAQELGGRAPDIVLEAAGSDAALTGAVELVRPGGRVAMIALHPRLGDVTVLGDLFHAKDCLLSGSWNDPVVPVTGSFDVFDNVAFALELMRDGRLDCGGLLTHVHPAADVGAAMRQILDSSDFVGCGLRW